MFNIQTFLIPMKTFLVFLLFLSTAVYSQKGVERCLQDLGYKTKTITSFDSISVLLADTLERDSIFFRFQQDRNTFMYFSNAWDSKQYYLMLYENTEKNFFYELTLDWRVNLEQIKNADLLLMAMYEGYYFDLKKQLVVHNVFESEKNSFDGFVYENGTTYRCNVSYSKSNNNGDHPSKKLKRIKATNRQNEISTDQIKPSGIHIPMKIFMCLLENNL